MSDADALPEWAEVLSRPAIAVHDNSTDEELEAELLQRLAALLESYNGLEPTDEGWRALAVELALEYVPAFQIETPADRTGRSGLSGRPIGFGSFALRSRMKQLMRTGTTQAQAARQIERESKGEIKAKTAQNVMSKPAGAPDVLSRARFKTKASRAALRASKALSREP